MTAMSATSTQYTTVKGKDKDEIAYIVILTGTIVLFVTFASLLGFGLWRLRKQRLAYFV